MVEVTFCGICDQYHYPGNDHIMPGKCVLIHSYLNDLHVILHMLCIITGNHVNHSRRMKGFNVDGVDDFSVRILNNFSENKPVRAFTLHHIYSS